MQSFRQYRRIGAHVSAAAASLNGRKDAPSDSKAATEHDPRDGVKQESNTSTESEEPTQQQVPVTAYPFVDWDASDMHLAPRNWSTTRRTAAFVIIWINCFAVDWPATADAGTSSKSVEHFGQSKWAACLGAALYTFGIAVGALFAGPISETVGRNPIYVGSRIWNVIWLAVAAPAPNFATYCVARFFAGTGGSIILAIHAASIADLYDPIDRTLAWPTVAMASFSSTMLAPVASGWIAKSTTLSFRWADYISLIISGAVVIITILFLPETFAPILLKWKATHLRRVTGSPNHISRLEQQPTFATRLQAAFLRAAHMFSREPIVILLGVWLVLVYIIVYGFVQSFSFVFGLTYGWNKGQVGSAFGAICMGVFIWYASAPFYWYYYKRKVAAIRPTLPEKEQDVHVAGIDLPPPEYRLWTAAPVAPGLPISLFWLAWTNYASISPWSSLSAMALFGVCWAGIYVTVYNYILDVYGIYAGSALAIITFFRYTASAGISMVSRPMYLNIHVHWSMTLFGCLAILLAPVPLALAWMGPRLREKSRFASEYAREARDRIDGKA